MCSPNHRKLMDPFSCIVKLPCSSFSVLLQYFDACRPLIEKKDIKMAEPRCAMVAELFISVICFSVCGWCAGPGGCSLATCEMN